MDRVVINILAGVILFVGSVALLGFTISANYSVGTQIATDAGLMPKLLLLVAAASAAAMIVEGVRHLRRNPGLAPRVAEIGPGRLLLACTLVGVFVASFNYLGYWLTVLLFIPAFSLCFGYRNKLVIATTTVGFATLIWVVFVHVLLVEMQPLPAFL